MPNERAVEAEQADARQAVIERCLHQLNAGDPRTRADAARRLGELHAAPAALTMALGDHNGYVRAAAAIALGQTGPNPAPDIVDGLLAAIDDRNDYVCAAALRSLGRLKVEAARTEIIDCLQDAQPRVVEAAILALARLGPAAVAETLAPFLSAPDPFVRAAAAQAAGMLGNRAAAPLILASLDTGLQALLAARRAGDLKLLAAHIEALAQLGAQEAVPLLIGLAQHQVGLRTIAVQALARLAPAAAAPLLLPLIGDPNSQLRESLVALMAKAEYRPALPALRLLLADAKTPVRLAALELLTAWHDVDAAPQVRAMCFHEANPYVRPPAIAALAGLLDVAALPDLLQLAGDRNPHVRAAAATALGSLRPLPAAAASALARLAGDEQAPVGEAAYAALAAHGLDAGALAPFIAAPAAPSHPAAEDLLPAELSAEAPALCAMLDRWQAALPSLVGQRSPERLAAIDRALAELLVVLRSRR